MIRLLERLELTTSSRRMEGAQHHKKIALDVWKANLTRMEGQTRRWGSLPLFYVAHLLPIGMLSSPDICEWIPPPLLVYLTELLYIGCLSAIELAA